MYNIINPTLLSLICMNEVNLILDVVNNLPRLDKLSCSPLNELQFSCFVRKANKSAFDSESGMPVVYQVHSRFISLC